MSTIRKLLGGIGLDLGLSDKQSKQNQDLNTDIRNNNVKQKQPKDINSDIWNNNTNITEYTSVVDANPEIFDDIAKACNVTVEWIKKLEKDLSSARQITSDELIEMFMVHIKDKQISGPHQMTVLEIAGPSNNDPKMITILSGEVHGNPDGCADNIKTIFRIITNVLRKSNNVFLILESFFHLIPEDIQKVKTLSSALQSRSENNEHSIWNACACIAADLDHCNVESKRVGQLILFRAFSFIIQSIAAYLNSIGIYDSDFQNLYDRVHHMDPREDGGLTPYEWIKDNDKNSAIRRMLKHAKPKMVAFIPELEKEDLCEWYTKRVKEPLLKQIDDCIANPSRELYDEIFTSATELVSLALHFHIMEKHIDINPHVIVVAGDRHRELILDFLRKCLTDKLLSERTYKGYNGKTSCISINN